MFTSCSKGIPCIYNFQHNICCFHNLKNNYSCTRDGLEDVTCICNTVEQRATNWILLCLITFMKGHIWVLFTQYSKGLFCCLEEHTFSIFRVTEYGLGQCLSNWVEGTCQLYIQVWGNVGQWELWTGEEWIGLVLSQWELRDSRMAHRQMNGCKWCTAIKKVCFITSTKQIIVTNNKKLKLAWVSLYLICTSMIMYSKMIYWDLKAIIWQLLQ